jgi:hypothetical protein
MAVLNQQNNLDFNQAGDDLQVIEKLSFKHITSVGSLLRHGVAFGLNVHSIQLMLVRHLLPL